MTATILRQDLKKGTERGKWKEKDKDKDIYKDVAANKVNNTVFDQLSEITNGLGLLIRNGNEINITQLPRINEKILTKFYKQSMYRVNHVFDFLLLQYN